MEDRQYDSLCSTRRYSCLAAFTRWCRVTGRPVWYLPAPELCGEQRARVDLWLESGRPDWLERNLIDWPAWDFPRSHRE